MLSGRCSTGCSNRVPHGEERSRDAGTRGYAALSPDTAASDGGTLRVSLLAADDASLATFPDEFRQGMAARAAILGDTGTNHPDHWVGGLASPDLHAIVILFAREVAERERCVREHQQYASQFSGVE